MTRQHTCWDMSLMINKNSINAIIDTMVNKLATTLIAMFIFGALSLIPSFITPCAWGQPAPPTGDQVEQATKALDRDMGEEIEKRMMQVPKGPPKITEEVEPGEPEGPTFPVKKIKLVGVKTFTPEEFQSILVKYENRNVAVSELRILA